MPEIGGAAGFLVAAPGPGDGAAAGVVGRQGQQPVAVEALGKLLQVVQGGAGGKGDVAAAVVPPGLVEPEILAGGRNELPGAGGAAVGVGERVEGAFHHRQHHQLQRHVAALRFLDDKVQIALGALRDAGEIAGVAGVPLALQAHALPVLMQVQRVAVANPRPQILLRAFFLVGGGLNGFRFRHAVGEPRVFDGGLRRRHGRQVVHLGFRGTSAYHQREPQGCTTKKFIHNNNIRFEF